MIFEYNTGYFWINEYDLNEMATLVKNGCPVSKAIYDVASCWDDALYYNLDVIIDQLKNEVLRRAEKV